MLYSALILWCLTLACLSRLRILETSRANYFTKTLLIFNFAAYENPLRESMMITGTVKWFNAEKGYGFIAVEGEDDVFVHITAVQASGIELKEDMKVQFEKQQGNNGKWSAANLQAAD